MAKITFKSAPYITTASLLFCLHLSGDMILKLIRCRYIRFTLLKVAFLPVYIPLMYEKCIFK
jgi:hypothetical protein